MRTQLVALVDILAYRHCVTLDILFGAQFFVEIVGLISELDIDNRGILIHHLHSQTEHMLGRWAFRIFPIGDGNEYMFRTVLLQEIVHHRIVVGNTIITMGLINHLDGADTPVTNSIFRLKHAFNLVVITPHATIVHIDCKVTRCESAFLFCNRCKRRGACGGACRRKHADKSSTIDSHGSSSRIALFVR